MFEKRWRLLDIIEVRENYDVFMDFHWSMRHRSMTIYDLRRLKKITAKDYPMYG
jgi:hypothetical protein